MESYQGQLIKGEFSKLENEFIIQEIKHMETQSILQSYQIQTLYQYLLKQVQEEESCVITVNDQMPMHLNEKDTEMLLQDLDKLIHRMHIH
ncbi:hypothetical protein SAMN05421676_10474 [Salinibacillus kushneri]|uniref:Uncharacterized protein n=1 Tax=Salinibacillus kushneri TaxID=237682 RepID=A0A1I0DLQ5_9BACI|nr:hypothetical protein [Salinibacillus kushneri]SET33428.1 hypothetical protein SAMN05421676_10474 [Salinibacillus kushneri]